MTVSDKLMTEQEFQQWVIQLAEVHKFHTMYVPDSRRVGCPGWPDLVMAKPGRLIFAELKKQSGRVDPPQVWWMDRLREAGNEVYLWRPSDRDEIERLLSR